MYSCIICGHPTNNLKLLTKKCVAPMGNKLFPLNLLKCKKCGHIQKKIDNKWKSAMKNLYEKKYIFIGKHITVHKNKVYDRNKLITGIIDKYLKLSSKGDFLDIGCGAGYFVKSFLELKKNWNVYAHYLNYLNKKKVIKYKIKFFFTGEVNKINKKFDLISMNHVVEHLTEPKKVLLDVHKLLKDNGKLVIRLPNIKKVHNELTVLDHCSHFTKESLTNLLHLSGFKVDRFFNEINPTELFVIATKMQKKNIKRIIFSHLTKKEINNLNWLEKVCKKIENDKSNLSLGLFGVGTSTFYLYARLKNKIDFFVDEDPSKINNYYYKKKIYSTQKIPKKSKIFIAVHNYIFARKIAKRLKKRNPLINYIAA